MAVEKGFFGFIKRMFHKEKKPNLPLDQTALPPVDNATTRQEKKKSNANDFPAQVVEELRKVTPSHPAREVLGSAMFSEDAIARNTELGNLLLDLIHQPDSAAYHNAVWLNDLRNRLTAVDGTRFAKDSDQKALETIESNIDKLRSSAQAGDERIAKMKADVVQTKQGQAPVLVSTFQEAINSIPDSPQGIAARQAAERFLSNNQSRDDYKNLAAEFEIVLKDLVQKVDQTNDASRTQFEKNHQAIRQAYEKLGKMYVEKFQEGSRLAQEVQTRYGGSWELMEKALHENPDLRDYWFYHILEPVLFNSSVEGHRELYSLYVAGDMEDFMNIMGRMRDEQGRNVGRVLVDRYTVLKNTIFQSHDMDFYAAHPSQDIKEFITSTSLFLNRYIDASFQDPMVVLAKRLYEHALLSIRENHNGYIPREYLHWHPGKGEIILDRMVETLLKQSIENGQLFHIMEDPVTGAPLLNRWGRKQIDPTRPYTLDDLYGGQPAQSTDWRRQLGDLKVTAALKQAKGLALVDMRLLEIIGRSKGTGSAMDKTEYGTYTLKGPGFNSLPYEGIVRHIEPIIHYFTRFYIGGEKFMPFFNIMITERHDWNPDDMRRVIELFMDGEHDQLRKEFGDDIDTRLTAMDNPFGWSGMWGTYTKWRHSNATVDFDDWEMEQALSTANQLSVIGDKLIREHGGWQVGALTDEVKTQEYYLKGDDHWKGLDGRTAKQLYSALKNEYKNALFNSGSYELMSIASDEFEFERNWKSVGINQVGHSGKSYQKMLNEHMAGVKKLYGEAIENEMDTRQKKLERAYKARIWIKAAMRSPLIVARELGVDAKIAGFSRHGPLRKKIIYDILGIDIDDFGKERTPQKAEFEKLQPVLDLEGAVASVSQIAIRENRDLTDADFESIKDEKLRGQAHQYWQMVTKAMLGSHTADQWYKKLGVYYRDEDLQKPVGHRYHFIDWKQVDQINLDHVGEKDHSIFVHDDGYIKGTSEQGASDLLDTKLVDRDWRYLFSTEDMGWEYLNVGALGERNVVRRAGDLASHVQFNQGLEKLLTTQVGPRYEPDKWMETLKEMQVGMAGDDINVAYDSMGRILYTIGQMYRKADWAWKIPGISPFANAFKDASIMQILYGRTHGDAVGPNDLFKMIHMAEDLEIIPPGPVNKLTGKPTFWSEWNAELLEERLGATRQEMIYEMLTMAIVISILITLWRAFTAPDEESEGGGGGGN